MVHSYIFSAFIITLHSLCSLCLLGKELRRHSNNGVVSLYNPGLLIESYCAHSL